MFNLKEKLNQFLDDLEEEPGTEETTVAEQPSKTDASVDEFKAKQDELSSYLANLKTEPTEEVSASPSLTDGAPELITPPSFTLDAISQPEVKATVSMKEPEPITIPAQTASEISVLTDDFVVNGDIITGDPLQMNGQVLGNITCQNRLVVNGNVDGDIKAQSVSINSSTINGSISADENVIVTGESSVVGDIYNNSIAIDGILRGSIFATGKVKISENAEIYGNVTAASISMEEGAIIQGNVSIKASH